MGEMHYQLNETELLNCLYAAQAAAMRAGSRIMNFFTGSVETMSKGYGYEKSDLVTQADMEAQQIIEKVLVNYHPQIGFLAEENGFDTGTSRFEKPYFWSVDPMDGTKAFVLGEKGFAISIALLEQSGKPILGVCYFPASGNLFYGIIGQGAWFNEEKIKLSAENLKGDLKLLISEAETIPRERNAFFHHLCDGLSEITSINKTKPEMMIAPVHKGCVIIESDSPILYYGVPRDQLGVSLWDLSAIAVIVEAAGGYVSDMFGNPLELNRKESTFVHHKGFVFASTEEIGLKTIEAFQGFIARNAS